MRGGVSAKGGYKRTMFGYTTLSEMAQNYQWGE